MVQHIDISPGLPYWNREQIMMLQNLLTPLQKTINSTNDELEAKKKVIEGYSSQAEQLQGEYVSAKQGQYQTQGEAQGIQSAIYTAAPKLQKSGNLLSDLRNIMLARGQMAGKQTQAVQQGSAAEQKYAQLESVSAKQQQEIGAYNSLVEKQKENVAQANEYVKALNYYISSTPTEYSTITPAQAKQIGVAVEKGYITQQQARSINDVSGSLVKLNVSGTNVEIPMQHYLDLATGVKQPIPFGGYITQTPQAQNISSIQFNPSSLVSAAPQDIRSTSFKMVEAPVPVFETAAYKSNLQSVENSFMHKGLPDIEKQNIAYAITTTPFGVGGAIASVGSYAAVGTRAIVDYTPLPEKPIKVAELPGGFWIGTPSKSGSVEGMRFLAETESISAPFTIGAIGITSVVGAISKTTSKPVLLPNIISKGVIEEEKIVISSSMKGTALAEDVFGKAKIPVNVSIISKEAGLPEKIAITSEVKGVSSIRIKELNPSFENIKIVDYAGSSKAGKQTLDISGKLLVEEKFSTPISFETDIPYFVNPKGTIGESVAAEYLVQGKNVVGGKSSKVLENVFVEKRLVTYPEKIGNIEAERLVYRMDYATKNLENAGVFGKQRVDLLKFGKTENKVSNIGSSSSKTLDGLTESIIREQQAAVIVEGSKQANVSIQRVNQVQNIAKNVSVKGVGAVAVSVAKQKQKTESTSFNVFESKGVYSSSITIPKLKEERALKPVSIQEQVSKVEEIRLMKPITIQEQVSATKEERLLYTPTISVPITATKEERILKPITKTIEITATVEKEKLLSPMEYPNKIPKPKIPKMTLFKKKDFEDEFSITKQSGFNVLVRAKKGSALFLPISSKSFSLGAALKTGAFAVDVSKAASFKVVPSGKPVEEIGTLNEEQFNRMFRKSKRTPDVWVERRRFRISTAGEKAEITMKGINARRKKGRLFGF